MFNWVPSYAELKKEFRIKWPRSKAKEEVNHVHTQGRKEEKHEEEIQQEEKQEQKPEPLGLRKLFRQGEALPWKGIWFAVEKVNHDTMVLKAKTATNNVMQFKKERMRKLGQKI